MLSPIEAAALGRGQDLKRYVRAAAALADLFDDSTLADAVGIGRGAVSGWWRGSKPSPETLYRLADVTGLSVDELTRYVYRDGPPPTLPDAGSAVASTVEEGLRRGRERQQQHTPGTPEPSPRPRTRGSGAGRG